MKLWRRIQIVLAARVMDQLKQQRGGQHRSKLHCLICRSSSRFPTNVGTCAAETQALHRAVAAEIQALHKTVAEIKVEIQALKVEYWIRVGLFKVQNVLGSSFKNNDEERSPRSQHFQGTPVRAIGSESIELSGSWVRKLDNSVGTPPSRTGTLQQGLESIVGISKGSKMDLDGVLEAEGVPHIPSLRPTVGSVGPASTGMGDGPVNSDSLCDGDSFETAGELQPHRLSFKREFDQEISKQGISSVESAR
ncbi:hypothetical protein R1sor_019752 [Riccia sorocarpa]|uniref:Uncharacterized protein n=1 Tax=Riccia sorocarpa TaxID=122646 RepID=A0ABD3IDE5_9MARC